MPRRVRAKIRVSEIRRLAQLMCTVGEAASSFGLKKATFEEMLKVDEGARRAWEEGQADARISLRRKQMRLADNNASMAIFLGKQYLGQQEVQVTEVSGRDGRPIEIQEGLGQLNADQKKQLRTLLTAGRGKKP